MKNFKEFIGEATKGYDDLYELIDPVLTAPPFNFTFDKKRRMYVRLVRHDIMKDDPESFDPQFGVKWSGPNFFAVRAGITKTGKFTMIIPSKRDKMSMYFDYTRRHDPLSIGDISIFAAYKRSTRVQYFLNNQNVYNTLDFEKLNEIEKLSPEEILKYKEDMISNCMLYLDRPQEYLNLKSKGKADYELSPEDWGHIL